MNSQDLFGRGRSAYDSGNFDRAFADLMHSGKKGHQDAFYFVAVMYRWGQGVSESAEEAVHFYALASDRGCPQAALELSLILDPRSVSSPPSMQLLQKDAEKAKRYMAHALATSLRRAAEGDVEAMATLGLMYHHGFGTALDSVEAIKWYRKAFDLGHYFAANGLCLVFREAFDSKVRDPSEAMRWYSEAKKHNVLRVRIAEFENS